MRFYELDTENENVIYIDNHQAYRLYSWILNYPLMPLFTETFYNLLISDYIMTDIINFQDISHSIIEDKCKKYLKSKIVYPPRKLTPEEEIKFDINSREININRLDDIINLYFCIRNNISYSPTSYLLGNYVEIEKSMSQIFGNNIKYGEKLNRKQSIVTAKWIIEIEMPALFARNMKIIDDLRKKGQKWNDDDIEKYIFISPLELCDFLSNRKAIDELQSIIQNFSTKINNKYQLSDELKEVREKIDIGLNISNLTFKTISLILNSIPLPPLVSTGVTILETISNEVIKKPFNWLFHLNKINKKIRKEK